jgi:hypothetical protein
MSLNPPISAPRAILSERMLAEPPDSHAALPEDPVGRARQSPWVCVEGSQGAPRTAADPTLLPIAEIRTACRNATPVRGGRPEFSGHRLCCSPL